MRAALEFLNPLHKRGIYALPHVVVALIVLAVLAIAGVFAVQTYNAHFYRTHYRASLRVPHVYQRVHVPPKLAASLPSTGSIYLQYFTTATNDQGTIGSCQGWAFVKQASYAYNWNRQENGKHYHRFFSPRFAYDMVSAGHDQGSYLEQYPPIARAGIPRWITFPYGPYQVDFPIPILTPLYQLNITEHQLFADQGAGSGGVALIKQAISTHHAVNEAFPVFPEYDQANADGSTVLLPKLGETDRGGHANTCVKFDDTHPNGDGTVGAVLCSNQWNNYAGAGADGIRHSGPNNGFIWFSYSFVGAEVWDAAVIHVSAAPITARPSLQAGKPLSADGGNTNLNTPPYHFQHGPTIPPPPHASLVAPGAITSPQAAVAAGYAWHVKNVELTDATDASALVNQWGDYFHIWPLGIAATIGTESGYNPRAYRWQAGLDKSCGLMQLIVTNVEPVIHSYDPFAACQWEYSAANSIWLGARYYRDAFAYQRGCVQFPQAYGLYNAGYAWPCSFYYNLTGLAYSNYVANFLPNYSWALQHFQNFGPGPKPNPIPKPRPVHKPFPGHRWCRYSRSHGTHCPTHRWHERDTDIARSWRYFLDHAAGGAVTRERWNPKLGLEREVFAHRIAYSWPKYPRIVKWVNRPRKHAKR